MRPMAFQERKVDSVAQKNGSDPGVNYSFSSARWEWMAQQIIVLNNF